MSIQSNAGTAMPADPPSDRAEAADFPPLAFPDPWPPPAPTGGGLKGILLEWFGRGERCKREAIERQIAAGLATRPARNPAWPTDPVRQRIAGALAFAIVAEKAYWIRSVTLHPDDPIELLLWGPFDDLTDMVFRWELERQWGRGLSSHEWHRILWGNGPRFNNRRTVGDVVDACAAWMAYHNVTFPPPNQPKPGFQFSLFSLFIITTVVALFLGLARVTGLGFAQLVALPLLVVVLVAGWVGAVVVATILLAFLFWTPFFLGKQLWRAVKWMVAGRSEPGQP